MNKTLFKWNPIEWNDFDNNTDDDSFLDDLEKKPIKETEIFSLSDIIVADADPTDEFTDNKLKWFEYIPENMCYELFPEGKVFIYCPHFSIIKGKIDAVKYVKTLTVLNMKENKSFLINTLLQQIGHIITKKTIINIIEKTQFDNNHQNEIRKIQFEKRLIYDEIYKEIRYIVFNDILIYQNYTKGNHIERMNQLQKQKQLWINMFVGKKVKDKNFKLIKEYIEKNRNWTIKDLQIFTELNKQTIYTLLKENNIKIVKKMSKTNRQIKDFLDVELKYNRLKRIDNDIIINKIGCSIYTLNRFFRENTEYQDRIDEFNSGAKNSNP